MGVYDRLQEQGYGGSFGSGKLNAVNFGGKPVDPESKYDFGTITSATDIVKLAHRLEEGAAKAYLTHAYKLASSEILNAAVPILVDEVRHTTVFKQLLGLSVTERLKV